MSNLIDGLKDCSDAILSIRESIGADKRKVYIVTRTWSGAQPGDGQATEVTEEVSPTPGIRDFSHDMRIREGGIVKQGDLMLKMLSKHRYPCEADVRLTSSDASVEKFYLVGKERYRVIAIVEKHLTWDVQVRRFTDQTPVNS